VTPGPLPHKKLFKTEISGPIFLSRSQGQFLGDDLDIGKVFQLNGLARAFGDAHPAALAFGRVDVGGVILVVDDRHR
jgi:hypothetical protein